LVVAGLDEPLARRGDGRQKFFSCVGARASVSAPRATACHCTRCGRAHRVGQKEHRRGKRRAPGEHRGAPRPSPRSAQVTIHYPPSWTCSCPTSPGRLGVPRATRATRWPPPRRRRPARPAAAPSPGPSSPGPEAPKQCKHVSLPCLGSESYPSPVDQRRRTKTPLKRLQIQFGFGAWKINVLVDHFTHYVHVLEAPSRIRKPSRERRGGSFGGSAKDAHGE
jgi:hypothetical protein